MYKKAQVWYLDFIIGTLIFVFMITIFFMGMESGFSSDEDSSIESIMDDASSISENLMGAGYPSDWDAGNVAILGVTDNNHRINDEKWASLSEMDYIRIRGMLRTKYDLFFFAQGGNGCIIPIGGIFGIGNPEVVLTNSSCVYAKEIDISGADPDNLVLFKRPVIADGKPANLVVYVWN